MGKGNRQRQLARQRAMRQAARREEMRRRRRRQSLVSVGMVITLGALVGGLALAGVFSGSDKKTPAAAAGATPSAGASSSPAAFNGTCTYTAKPTQATGTKKPGLPPSTSNVKGVVQVKFVTTRGPLLVNLDADRAPCTVNALNYLVSKKFFDGTTCTRVTTGATLKILQCGDPSGTGSGGPGFSYADEGLTGATYKRGTVAMANSGPNTNGSQLFFVDADSTLPASYTPVGTIVGGLANLDKAIKAGTSAASGDGPPSAPITLTSVALT